MKNTKVMYYKEKTFTIDPITHKRMINKGEEDKYYIENNHEAIVSAEVYEKKHKVY